MLLLWCLQPVQEKAADIDVKLIASGSELPDVVFVHGLACWASESPNVPFVHLAPSVVCEWLQRPESTSEAEEEVVLASMQQCIGSALQSSTPPPKYLALHSTHEHYCSLLFNVELWKTDDAARQGAKSKRVRPFTRRGAVPVLHLDTLPQSCPFEATSTAVLLRRVCCVFNRLFETKWSTTPSSLASYVAHAGPEEQSDLWSCGYRLLYAWSLLLPALNQQFGANSSFAVSAVSLNEICSQHKKAFDSSDGLVQFAQGLYKSCRVRGTVSEGEGVGNGGRRG